MVQTEDITSFAERLTHLKDHLRQVNATGRPMFITTDGETEAVVLSPAAYEKLSADAERVRGYAMLEQSMADIKAGRTMGVKGVIDDIAAEFGLTLERRKARD